MIEVAKLTKNFGPFNAVDQISFSVPRGQIMGFLGPNGAGKSTTMKMLTTFLKPTEGKAKIAGLDILENSLSVRKQLGYLPESTPLYNEMKVCEFLSFIAEMRSLHGSKAKAALDRVKDNCSLKEVWYQTIQTLSKGFRQRVGFAQAILHDPPVLILDEPTDGLDPNQKHEMRRLIKEMGTNKNKTIILSTHILEEVEAICQRAVIICNGKIVADATPQELKKRSQYYNAVTVKLRNGLPPRSIEMLTLKPEIEKVQNDEEGMAFTIFPKRQEPILNNVMKWAKDENWEINEMHVDGGHLDEVFRKITKAI